eukprot:CAMPEP_0201487664 /NCGR_PEP_ID=MMETSP0151_2-20130828/14774_1 /ASSEMBLY_ACC=CAM_ASM_000257 /TAXON_ID=200890 /ORGANISM="Paramoeba atlantica, Strain 621/1 / CCAP 1560/9" /LENGTH=245 /DNA_ID=CAMNT_0047872777 /DNA_START=145 /DNA_END=882 /DNA_ORIENTATION=-
MESGITTFISDYSLYEVNPTCTAGGNQDVWTIISNYTVSSHPNQELNILASTGAEQTSNLACEADSNSSLFYDEELKIVGMSGGVLYSYNPKETKSCQLEWDFAGEYGTSCLVTFDVAHSQFLTECSYGLTLYDYKDKTTRTVDNDYQMISIDYDPQTNAFYGFARAAGNLLLYKLDQLLDYTLINVIWGYDLVNPVRTTISSPGLLTFLGTDGFATYLVTVTTSNASIVAQPLYFYPVTTFCAP